MGCMCSGPTDLTTEFIPKSTTVSLETMLRFETTTYSLHDAMTNCNKCSASLDYVLNLLQLLDQLSILYRAALSTFQPVKSTLLCHEAINTAMSGQSEDSGAASHVQKIEKSPVWLGRFLLEDEDHDMVGRIIVSIGLIKLQRTIRGLQRGAQSIVNDARGLDLLTRQMLSKSDNISALAQEILTRVWETKARGSV
ncbi:hypothetical protein C1H76_6696 [Elsinoe australis]|uniref:Uncharacterized protein n=1 Tax=Elsinoe australis TaxID=40998 RepID=A0A4U7AVE7_9PEZI|nr:hypothetical protein C1H76_6696 [Elsinoe australis]